MTIEREDRVKDQTTTTGTGTVTISGTAPTGYRTITSAHTTGATVRYTIVTSDLSEWEVGQGVWTSSGSTLTRGTVYASSNSGALVDFSTGTKVVFTGPVAADIDTAPTYPLMNYGGYQFDGATDYLDGNALTGIADGKKGTFVCFFYCDDVPASGERIITNTGPRFTVERSSTGAISVVGRNAANTLILSQATSGTPCSTAGSYVLMLSFDLASAGSMKIYVNDVDQGITSTTFTDDSIDYTVTEWSIGGSVGGTLLLNGDIYSIWFDPTTNLDFDTESVRRKFADVNNVPLFVGSHGELPTGTPPILFLGYDDFGNWPRNRGLSTTAFVENGTPGAVGTALYGQAAVIDASARVATRTIAVGNVTTGEDNLITYALAANALPAWGAGVHIIAWGTTANNANAKTLKLYFGTAVILTNALTVSIAGVWRIEADVISTGVDAQDYVSQLVTTGTAGVALNDIEVGTATQDDGATITIKCTGEATATDDIIQEGMIITRIGV